MNPSKTANPTTGVIEAGPYSCLTRKTKHFWHHKLVQTNTLLDSQTTNTHPSPQPKKSHVHWGHRFQCTLFVLRLAVPADVYSTSLRRSVQLEVHLRFTRIAPDQSDRHRSLRLGNLDSNTHLGTRAQNGPVRRPDDPAVPARIRPSACLGAGPHRASRRPAPRVPGSHCAHCPRPCRPCAGSHSPDPREPASNPAGRGHRC